MKVEGPQTPFEVFCPRCRTSFALGTKRCVHCGGQVSRERFSKAFELPPGSEDLVLEEDAPKARSSFSPFTLVWVALLLGGYLYRACSGG